jgi:hypothetical protein
MVVAIHRFRTLTAQIWGLGSESVRVSECCAGLLFLQPRFCRTDARRAFDYVCDNTTLS